MSHLGWANGGACWSEDKLVGFVLFPCYTGARNQTQIDRLLRQALSPPNHLNWPSKVILWHQHRFLSGKSSCLLGHTAPGLPEELKKTLHKCLRSDHTKTTVHIYKIKTANTKENRCSVQWLTIAMLQPIPEPSYYLWRFRGSRNQSVGYMRPLYVSFQITERKKEY